jgi:hypothetical protein
LDWRRWAAVVAFFALVAFINLESKKPIPSASTVTPLQAAQFVDAVGVNAHVDYYNTMYDTGWSTYSGLLIKSGIKHIRTGFCSYGYKSSFCTGTWGRRIQGLGAGGVKSDFVWDPRTCFDANDGSGCGKTTTPANEQISYFGLTSDVESVEGPNECDISRYCPGAGQPTSKPRYWNYRCTDFSSCMTVFIQDLWQLHSPTRKIYGPAIGHWNSSPGYACCGNQSASMDATSIHDYPGNTWPENGVIPRWRAQAVKMGPSVPQVSTETGYNTDPTFANNGVSLLAQERYIPRIILSHLEAGVMRVYLYELIDGGANGSGYQWGLLNRSMGAKPSWTRLLQMISYFNDSATRPQAITYKVTGDASGVLHEVWFQRSNGHYVWCPWLGTSQWNYSTHTDIAPTTEKVTLTLPAGVATATLTQWNDNGTVKTRTLSGRNGVFTVPVSSLTEALDFHL